jgi:hypothetical protein
MHFFDMKNQNRFTSLVSICVCERQTMQGYVCDMLSGTLRAPMSWRRKRCTHGVEPFTTSLRCCIWTGLMRVKMRSRACHICTIETTSSNLSVYIACCRNNMVNTPGRAGAEKGGTTKPRERSRGHSDCRVHERSSQHCASSHMKKSEMRGLQDLTSYPRGNVEMSI